MVKEELGADAVIMSNRTVDGGIEIVAARDFDEQSIQNKLQEQAADPNNPPADKAKKIVLPNFDAAKKRLQLLNSQRKQRATAYAPEQSARPHRFSTERDSSAVPGDLRKIEQYVGYAEKIQLRAKPETTAAKIEPSVDREEPPKTSKAPEKQINLSNKLLIEMSKELKYLRTAMDAKLATINWTPNPQATPARTDLLQRLAGMGISKKLSNTIANQFNKDSDPEALFEKAREMLVKVLPIAEDNFLEAGGIIALIGPTGVGKTTTIAKLAAKFMLKHGSNQLALITTDNYRIGAYEQLNTYGRILDVPVRVAANAEELRNFINNFADRRLILIDTAGMNQRDMKLVEQINTLQQNELAIKSYLVMSAATEYKAMNAIIKAFALFSPQASILTKLDEAVTIGSAISSIIEHNLPLSFITDGQQVPEDIHSPHAHSLIEHCVAELNAETNLSDVNNNVDYEPWVAQAYA